MEKQPKQEKEYTPEEIKKLNAQRGGFTSGMSRRGEIEKDAETGAWRVTQTPEGAELIEKARKEMREEFEAAAKEKVPAAPPVADEKAEKEMDRAIITRIARSKGAKFSEYPVAELDVSDKSGTGKGEIKKTVYVVEGPFGKQEFDSAEDRDKWTASWLKSSGNLEETVFVAPDKKEGAGKITAEPAPAPDETPAGAVKEEVADEKAEKEEKLKKLTYDIQTTAELLKGKPRNAAEKERLERMRSRVKAWEKEKKELEIELGLRPKKLDEEKTSGAEAKEREEREPVFSEMDLEDLRRDAEKARAKYESWVKIAHEAGLEASDVANLKWIADEKQKIYERALEMAHPEKKRIGEKGESIIKEAYRKESKKKNYWSWTKERIKGLVTMGWWEVHQAEKFRVAKKKVAEDIGFRAENLNQLEKLDIDEAWLEAQELKRKLGEKSEAAAYEAISNEITARKKAENDKLISALLRSAEKQLVVKLGAAKVLGRQMFEYKSASGEKVLTEEKLKSLKEELEKKLRSYQNGETVREWKDLQNIIKEKLDPEYWQRYVYGGVEMVLGAFGYKLLITKAVSGLGAKAAGVVKAGGGVNEGVTVLKEWAMKDNIWNTAREMLKLGGVSDPTDAQILEVSKSLALENHIAVPEWNIPGKVLDTQMPGGYLLKFAGAARIIARMAYGINI